MRRSDVEGLLSSAGATVRSAPRWLRWGAGLLASLLLVVYVGSYAFDEPIRSTLERRINDRLKGYYVQLPKAHLQLVGLTLTLEGLKVFQQANPDPPIAIFPLLRFSVHWPPLLRGRLVGEVRLERPTLWINLLQLRTEVASPVPIKEQGWQEAVEALYPLKVNLLILRDGGMTYIDQDPKTPLRLSRVNLRGTNIRNIRVPDKVYPSAFRLEAAIFGTGRGVVEGDANFLAEPFPGINARMKLDDVPLADFRPVIARANLSLRKGLFSGSGRIEYAPSVKTAQFDELTVRGMEIDYVHTARTAEAEKRRAAEVGKAVKEAAKSEMQVRVGRLRLERCTIGMVNENARHPYRVFLADADFDLSNLSNKFSQGPAEAKLEGRFMGSGPTRATAQIRPEKDGPDLDLRVEIEETRLTDMNELFRAYGRFDVAEGTFACYSELQIRNDAIAGYIKPFFKDMKVYDKRTDREKRRFRELYERLVGGVAKLLESPGRGEIAAKAEISGPVTKPRISTWQILGDVISNAFFKTILPGFESEASRSPRR